MRKEHLLKTAAFFVHALLVSLPVEKNGVSLPTGSPGWHAFRVAVAQCGATTVSDSTDGTTLYFRLSAPLQPAL
jgi:hypothetical protein